MGHCLGTGIVDDDKAAAVAAHLVGPLLNSGFEVRTLATDMNAFTPMSYHNRSVWPHDTAIAIKGLANYSFVEETQQDCGLLDASEYFGGRLPELFCAFSRAEFTCPLVSCGLQLQVSSALTRFAVAASWCQCPPQSWGFDDEGGSRPLSLRCRVDKPGSKVSDRRIGVLRHRWRYPCRAARCARPTSSPAASGQRR